jgi:hypothetical protein
LQSVARPARAVSIAGPRLALYGQDETALTARLWESSYVPLLSSHFNLRLRRLRFLADGSMI